MTLPQWGCCKFQCLSFEGRYRSSHKSSPWMGWLFLFISKAMSVFYTVMWLSQDQNQRTSKSATLKNVRILFTANTVRCKVFVVINYKRVIFNYMSSRPEWKYRPKIEIETHWTYTGHAGCWPQSSTQVISFNFREVTPNYKCNWERNLYYWLLGLGPHWCLKMWKWNLGIPK